MTRDEIIALALETGAIFNEEHGTELAVALGRERIVQLVEAAIAQDRKKHQADIERWKGEAAKAEKWRGLALAKDGDGRTVQVLQAEARAEEREACARLVLDTKEWKGGGWSCTICPNTAKNIASAIRGRGAPQSQGGRSIIETMAAELVAKEQAQASRIANRIAKGQCPDCDGEGEIGGQFCGGYQACEKCGGTGKSGGNP